MRWVGHVTCMLEVRHAWKNCNQETWKYNFMYSFYGCKIWSLTSREEHRLRVDKLGFSQYHNPEYRDLNRLTVLENWVLTIFWWVRERERQEVKGGWRKLHNVEFHKLCSSTNISMMKSGRMRSLGPTACMVEKIMYERILVRKLEWGCHLRDLGIDWRMILRWSLMTLGLRVWTRFTWLRILSSGRLLCTQWWAISQRCGIYWISEWLLAFQGLYSMELVNIYFVRYWTWTEVTWINLA